jgi:hypothetical protein
MGGGANPKKNIEHVSNGRKKNRTSLTPEKKNIEHKKFLNKQYSILKEKFSFPEFFC